jgi:hypothetical protein
MSRDYLKKNEYTGDPLWLEYLGRAVFALFIVGVLMI